MTELEALLAICLATVALTLACTVFALVSIIALLSEWRTRIRAERVPEPPSKVVSISERR